MALRADLPARWLAALGAGAVALGLLTGVNPTVGISIAFAIAFALLMLNNLTVGVVLFTVISFIDVIQLDGKVVSGVKVAGAVLVFSWVAATVTQGRERRGDFFKAHPAFVFVIFAFLGWVLLSAAWAESPSVAMSAAGRYALDACLFPIVYAAVGRREHVVWIVVAFIVGALISVAYGLVVPVEIARDSYRLGGAVGEANETATVLIAAVVLSTAVLGFIGRSPALRLAALGGGVLALAGMFTTLSRAGFVGLGVALLAGVVVGGRWRGRLAVMAVFVVAGTLIYVFALAGSAAQQHVESANTSGRATIWQVAWREVSAHPLVGVGADNFSVSSIHYINLPGAIGQGDDTIVDQPKVAHNIYLETWADLGLVGLVLLVAIIGFSLRCALRAAQGFKGRDRQLELMSRMLIVAIIAILAADFFASNQYSKQLWLLMALCPTMLALSRRGTTLASTRS